MIETVVDLFGLLNPFHLVVALAVASALMLLLEDRRLSVLSLLAQYILLGILMSPQLYHPLALLRIGLGTVLCLILYISAMHVQRTLKPAPQAAKPAEGEELDADVTPDRPQAQSALFRLLVVILGGFITYAIWRAYSLPLVPTELLLTVYWLMAIGILMLLISRGPLRQGMGLLTALSGFEALYMLWQTSFVVISILGTFNLLVALAIAFCAEAWLESVEGEASET